MQIEILIALIGKMVDERLTALQSSSSKRGPRGFQGRKGVDGKDFNFAEHEEVIRAWTKEFALKFEDLSNDQIETLRGPRGRDGHNGSDGRSFIFEENRDAIEHIIRSTVDELRDSLRLRFSDLSDDEIGQLRGPRGRDGRDGRDFIFDNHRDFFEGLRLKFSDLTDEEKNALKIHFSDLTQKEKESLKLKFEDLTDGDRILLRGPRGLRGQRGSQGRDGKDGLSIRGLPGPQGLPGLPGQNGFDGRDGLNGLDASYIIDIHIEESGGEIIFVFEFSDGTEIRSNKISLPASVNYYGAGASGGSNNSAFVRTQYTIADGDGPVVLDREVFDGTINSSVYYIAEITRGTDVFLQGELSMNYRNGTWYRVTGSFRTDNGIASGVTFDVNQVGTIGTLEASCTSGPGDATIKLKRVTF